MTSGKHEHEQDHTILLGQRLKQARTGKGLSLEKIAADIRIHSETLAALEENNKEALPAEVFTRGFVKIYAQHLGMDPDEALRIHIEEQGLPASPASQKINIQEIMAGESMAESPIGLTGSHFFSGLLIILIALFGYWGYQNYWRPIAEISEKPVAILSTPMTPPETIPATELEPAAISAEESAPESATTTPAPEETSTAQPAPAPVPEQPAPMSQPDTAPPPTGTPSITPEKAKQIAPATAPAKPQDATVAPESAGEINYVLRADFSEDTWLRIQIDGQPSRQLFFQVGDTHTWEAAEKMQLFIGNAGGVLFTLNDSPLPGLGPSGKTARLNIPPRQGNQ